MKLSIIMPVYNEKNTIMQILKKVDSVKLKSIKKELIIVDDFSTDGTIDILKKLKKYKIIFHEKNKGKGSAIRTGLKYATGDIITIQDADLEYDPNDYQKLLIPILENKAQVVYGSRFLNKTFKLSWRNKIHQWFYYLGNNVLTLATNIIYFSNITDMETCYKVFKKDVIKSLNLKAERFDIEPEITAKTLRKGYKIYEVPITFNPRSFKEGKKINWKDGLKALFVLIKLRFF